MVFDCLYAKAKGLDQRVNFFGQMKLDMSLSRIISLSVCDLSGVVGRKTPMMFDARQAEKTDAPLAAQQYAAQEQMVSRRKDGPVVQADEVETDWTALVLRVRDHQDKAAFAALFRHFAPRVKAFLMKSGADATLAEECAQDVMATLWQKAHLFDPARASVATWVFTIARNLRIDRIRRDVHMPTTELGDYDEPSDAPEGEELLGRKQEDGLVARALQSIPEEQRQILLLSFVEDMPQSEIAARLSIPLGTVKSRMRLAYGHLRRLLETGL